MSFVRGSLSSLYLNSLGVLIPILSSNKILVGAVVKAKLGDLEEGVREGFSRRPKK